MSRPAALLAAAAALLLHGACAAADPSPAPPCPEPLASSAPCAPRPPEPYTPLPAPSASASLPPLPALPDRPERDGDAYTVWGLKKALRLPGSKLEGTEVTVVGYVSGSNFGQAPACALHPVGKADPPGCTAPIPWFTLADDPADERWRIKVMGFASSWANLFTAQQRERARQPHTDGFWGVVVPSPLPARGARMRLVGQIGRAFTKASSGIEVDPGGILTYREGSYLGPPPAPAVLGAGKGAKPAR